MSFSAVSHSVARLFTGAVLTVVGANALCVLRAQTGGEPEVRRAIPVQRSVEPSDYDNPPWVQRVLPAQPVNPPPTPPPAPVPAETPYRPPLRPDTAEQVAPPAAPPPASTPAPAVQSTPDQDGSIRIAPASSPDSGRAKLDLANSLYVRKMYDLAIPEYEMFLISGTGEGRDAALFRLAECHRMMGNPAAARAGYEKLVVEFRSGEFAGAGAYRLGEILFAEHSYEPAHLQFETAATESKDPSVRLTAKYFSARSLDYLKRPDEAAAAYKAVADADGKNPYREHALLALAELDVKAGRKAEALAGFQQIADSKSGLSSEASVKAAALAVELGQRDKALALFDKVAKDSTANDWRPIALIGAMRLRYQGGDYKGVTAMGPEAVGLIATDAQPEALQLLAASYRQVGNNLEARRTYDRLLKDFPDAAPAADARFQRLVSLYMLNDKTLVPEIDAFLEKTTDPKARAQASLLKGETLYKQGDFAGAGQVYEALSTRELDPSVRADVLFKLGWCRSAAGDFPGSIAAYSEFLEKYPSHALASSALARRGLAHQQNKAYDSALADFAAVAAKAPGTPEHELALLQTALIHGQQKNYDAMKKDFSQLLAAFPKTSAAGQANFWLGWAAFEEKDYKSAVELLDKARKADPGQYRDRATLRIILAYFYLQDRAGVIREADAYKGGPLPAEITLWLAAQYLADGNDARAESLLAQFTANPSAVTPDTWIQLAECRLRLKKFQDARAPVEKYLAVARDPVSRARGLLAKARIEMALKNLDAANALVEEALLLQPEGPLNVQARMASADVLMARANYDAAARTYMTVSLLSADPAVAPEALKKASDAYRKAGNTFEADRALAELREKFPDLEKTAKNSKDK